MNYRRLIFSFLIFFTSFFVYSNLVFASTPVTSDIAESTTWTVANSPYILEGYISVLPGATLNIQQGVIVKAFQPLFVYGNLNVEGTETEKVYFTSWFDDELGGDTDGKFFDDEGSEVNTAPNPETGEYLSGGISIPEDLYNPKVVLDHVVVRYADRGLVVSDGEYTNVSNSVFEKNSTAIFLEKKNKISVLNSIIRNNNNGIKVSQEQGAPPSVFLFVEGLSVYDNLEHGVENSVYVPSYQTRNDKSLFDWLVYFFSPSEVLAQEDPVVIEEDSTVVDEEEPPVYDYTLDFRNTWWGDMSGPYNSSSNPNGHGNAVSGDILFTPFCKNPNCTTRNPVIIVPGLLGTEISKTTANGTEKLWLDLGHNLKDVGDQFMDALQFKSDLTPSDMSLVVGGVIKKVTGNILGFKPKLFDYSASLLEEFTNQGYIEDTDLFLFPYDWRFGVSEDTVNKLKQKVRDILTQTGSEKVDIVAHSMGGLITKKYVVENPNEHHIDKAIFVGVPNTGSVKAVKNLLTGDGNILTSDKEMQKLSVNMPAAYDLLPSEEYFNKKGSYVQITEQEKLVYKNKNLNFSEVSSFLAVDHSLNVQAVINAHHLHTSDFDNYDLRTAGINLYAINGCKAGTLSKIKELRDHNLLFDFVSVGYYRPEESPGDGTVPLESATNLPINQENKFYALEGTHADMLSANGIRQKIVNILSGSAFSTKNNKDEEIITQDIDKCELNGKAISIYSPLAIDIVDQDGNHAGLSEDGVSIENNIPNADFQIMGEHKFVYLPTDDGQTYTISVTGTGTGAFTLTDATIDSNEVADMQVFKNIAVTPSLLGRLNISDNTTLALDDNGDKTIDRTLSPTFILSGEEARDFIPGLENVEVAPEKNNLSSSSSSRVSGSSVNKQELVQPAEIADSPIVTLENSIKNTLIKQQEETKKFTQVENTEKNNLLTASIANTNTPVDYKIIIISLFGILGLLLLAQKYNKG